MNRLTELLGAEHYNPGALAGKPAGESLLVDLKAIYPLILEYSIKDAGAVAENSYRHALGFTKLVLAGVSSKWQLRLHIWNNAARHEEDLHNHRFDFSSLVLCGSLTNDTYEVGRSPSGPLFGYVEDAVPSEQLWRFTYQGRYWARRLSTRRIPSESTYSMEGDSVHRVLVGREGGVATLILVGSDTAPSTLVLRAKMVDPSAPPRHQGRLSQEEVTACLRWLGERGRA